MGISDADRLYPDDGPKLELRDGRKVTLYFGYRGLRLIEQQYGSFKKFSQALSSQDGAQFTAIIDAIAIGSWKSGLTVDDVEELLEPEDLEAHMDAVTEALMRSFPRQVKEAAEDATSPSLSPQATPNATSENVAPLSDYTASRETSQSNPLTGEPTTTQPLSFSGVNEMSSGT